MIRKSLTFLAAVLAIYVVATVLASNSVLDNVVAMGLPVSLGKRITVIAHDLVGMATSLLPLIVIGFLIAFLTTALLTRWWPRIRIILYVIAGAVAVIGIHTALNLTFDITPVAAARTTGGLLMQGVAGALGGYLFARFSISKKPEPT